MIVLYSWPSGNDISSYDHDRDNADWSVDHLTGVLRTLVTSRGIERLHLMAHSMGSRVLGLAIKALVDSGVQTSTVDNVIFAAPDVDQPTFLQFASRVNRLGRHRTLYVSQWDGALRASTALHRAPRVGLLVVGWAGMDVIDTEGMDTSAFNLYHSYVFDSQPVLYDLFLVTQDFSPVNRVGLIRTSDNCCWQFQHR